MQESAGRYACCCVCCVGPGGGESARNLEINDRHFTRGKWARVANGSAARGIMATTVRLHSIRSSLSTRR